MPMVCEAHKYHSPKPTYLETHHVVPQSWQKAVHGGKLFDPRTVELCRTGHGNVHWWLVIMNHRQADLTEPEMQPINVLLKGFNYGRTEVEIAHLALTRWVSAGYPLAFLWEHRMWGYV